MRNEAKPADAAARGDRDPAGIGRTLRSALGATAVTLVLCGLCYPLAMTALSLVLLPAQARGSLVRDEHGQVVGSELIGQVFTRPAYFQGRVSSAGAAGAGYDALASGGSNLGVTSQKLRARVIADVERLRRENPEAPLPIPADLVTASASGLDPHVSPAAALWQVPRVARARGVSSERVRAAVEAQIEGRQIGILGEPRVNVLLLNLSLDRQLGRPTPAPAAAPSAPPPAPTPAAPLPPDPAGSRG